MAKSKLRMVRMAPGLEPVKPHIDRLVKAGNGWVTSFSDARLRAVADLIPQESGVETVSFGALVSKVMSYLNEPVDQLPQKGLVQAAIGEASGNLTKESPFFGTKGFRGLHARIADSLDDLHSWGLDSEKLVEIAGLCSPVTAAKVGSLATLDREVKTILGELGRSFNADNIHRMLEIDLQKEINLPEILLLAGSDYSPVHADWILRIAEIATRVTVFIECHAEDGSLFEDAQALQKHLKVKAETTPCHRPLLECLFTEKTASGDIPEMTIQSTSDPLAEVEWALRDCLQLNKQGVLWGEMGIFVRDLETYGPLIQAASKRLGVPTYAFRRGPILENGYARLMLQTLTFLASNDVRTLTPLLRNSYIEVDRSLSQQLVGVAKESSRDKTKQWSLLLDYVNAHEAEVGWLKSLLEWRRLAIQEPLTMAAWVERIRKLPEGQPWLDKTAREGSLSSRDARIHTALQRVLIHTASIRRVRRDETMTLAQVVAEVQEIWSEADCSIPPASEGIRVYNQSEGLQDLHSLHVLGMLEGVFPRRRSEDPILTDDERAEISAHLDTAPLPDSRHRARAERDHFYRICAAAKHQLVFSYPLTGDDRDNVPAFYLDELRRVAGSAIHRKDYARTQWAPPLNESACYSDDEMASALAGDRDVAADETFGSIEAALLSRPVDGEALKPRQLRDAFECPFRFFARHRLNLYGGRSNHLWSRLYALPGSVSLATISSRDAAITQLKQALYAELDNVVADVDEWQIGVVKAGGERLIEEWVGREFAAREKWPSDPGSLRTNVSFGEEGLKSSLKTLTGDKVVLEGMLPSISHYRNVSVGHLYRRSQFRVESGNKFELDGDALELGTYLAALFERGKGAALDVESMSDRRMIYITDFENPLDKFEPDKITGLEVKPLGPPNVFIEQIRQGLGQAMATVLKAKTTTNPGDHCKRCDMGELCRKSSEFSEEESPFGDE